MSDIIKLKRGTDARWAEVNPILNAGEPGYALDTGILKIGNGTTPWNDLQAIGPVTDSDIENIVADYLNDHPITYADLDVVGAGRFVILEHDTDSSSVPDGTFIARLPSDWTP